MSVGWNGIRAPAKDLLWLGRADKFSEHEHRGLAALDSQSASDG
jgi:hypothetical protein